MGYMLNRSVIDEVRVDRVAEDLPILALRYFPMSSVEALDSAPHSVGEGKNAYHRVEVDADGSSDASELLVNLYIGDTVGTATKYSFTADASHVDATATITVCATLQAMVDAMNAIAGVQAYVLHAPTNLSLAAATFIDVALTDVPYANFLEILPIDQSAAAVAYLRVGNPEPRDQGRMKVLGLNGVIVGATSGTVKVYRDDEADSGAPAELLSFAAAASETAYIADKMDNCSVYRGPLLVEVDTDAITTSPDIKLRTVQAEW